jgi:pimeloyl-ACP methyl ester carboxylesterase
VIALDLPGFGASPPPSDPISIPGYARIVARLMGHLGVDAAVVVGSSLGGWVAAQLTLDAPARVSRLVLVDAAGIVPTPYERRKVLSLMEMAAMMAPLAPRFRQAIASRRRLRAMALRYTTAKPAQLAADLVFTALPSAPDPGFRPALRACKRAWSEAWCESLDQITCPTLVVWGDRDSLLPVRHGREYARRIPGCRLVVVSEAGHLPMLEHPTLVNTLFSEFLAAPALDGIGEMGSGQPADNMR